MSKTIEKVLIDQAANNIEKYGWIQGDTGTKSTGFCIVGGLSFTYERMLPDGNDKIWLEAISLIEREIKCGIPEWNDMVHRTKDQVLNTLRKAAK